LAHDALETAPSGGNFVVFISSLATSVPIWMQKCKGESTEPVFWDYHVIFVRKEIAPFVYDLDTLLPMPCPASDYMLRAFRPGRKYPEAYAHRFRVVPARDFVERFASDRRHMKKNNQWLAPPPEWKAICGPLADSQYNLDEYRMMDVGTDSSLNDRQQPGKVLTLAEFKTWLMIE